jgi:hypothetical protein
MPREPKPNVSDDVKLNERIHAKRDVIAAYLQRSRFYDGLTRQHRDKLTDLVMRYQAAFRQFQWFSGLESPRSDGDTADRPSLRDLHADQKHGASQRRMFSRKIGNAVEALQEAIEYATDLSKTRVYAGILKSFAVPKLAEVKNVLAEIAEWNDLLAPASDLNLKHPRREATEALMTFFEVECGLDPADARHRTAVIFTGFKWRQSVSPDDKPKAVIGRESDAVRKRHARSKRR